MKKLTRAELLALFPKQQMFIEQRLRQEYVDGIVVFEGDGRKTACVYGGPYTLKRWQDAEGGHIQINYRDRKAVSYYEKPSDEIEAIAAE